MLLLPPSSNIKNHKRNHPRKKSPVILRSCVEQYVRDKIKIFDIILIQLLKYLQDNCCHYLQGCLHVMNAEYHCFLYRLLPSCQIGEKDGQVSSLTVVEEFWVNGGGHRWVPLATFWYYFEGLTWVFFLAVAHEVRVDPPTVEYVLQTDGILTTIVPTSSKNRNMLLPLRFIAYSALTPSRTTIWLTSLMSYLRVGLLRWGTYILPDW